MLKKLDGCAAHQGENKNDWVWNCTAQQQAHRQLNDILSLLKQNGAAGTCTCANDRAQQRGEHGFACRINHVEKSESERENSIAKEQHSVTAPVIGENIVSNNKSKSPR